MLYKPEVTQGVVTPYIFYTRNTFSLINPLAAFSQIFKAKPYFNAGGKYIFSSPSFFKTRFIFEPQEQPLLRTHLLVGSRFAYETPAGRAVPSAVFFHSCASDPIYRGGRKKKLPSENFPAQDTGLLYSTSSKPKGKSYDFFQKIYSDKSANNPFFIVNNFFKQYPNTDLAKANLDYKLINTILGNHTFWQLAQHRRTASSYYDASAIRKKIGVLVRVIKTYAQNAISINPLMLDFFTHLIQEHTDGIIEIKLPDGRKLIISREFIE